MFWLAFKSGYCSETIIRRLNVPARPLSAETRFFMVPASPGFAAAACDAA